MKTKLKKDFKIAFCCEPVETRLGMASVIAMLTTNGFTNCDVFFGDSGTLEQDVINYNPDVLAYGLYTNEAVIAIDRLTKIKKEIDPFVVIGGMHATFYPDTVEEECVDATCIGEGEYAILELCEKLRQGEDCSSIASLWVKTNGTVVKNQMRPFISNLDDLPFPNREIFYRKSEELRNTPLKHFFSSRGCPYPCSFCFAEQYSAMNNGKDFCRFHSPEYLIKQIKEIKDNYPLETIKFFDSTFTLNYSHVKAFLPRFKDEIGIPYLICSRFDRITDEIAKLLKDTGCDRLGIGLESGDESMRNDVLKKRLKDEDIYKGAAILSKYGLRVETTNMIGLPGETLKQAFKTIKINQDIKVRFAQFCVFIPEPKTELANYCIKNGYLDKGYNFKNMPRSYHSGDSPLKQKDIKRLCNLHMFADFAIHYPFLNPLIKLLILLPNNNIYRFIYQVPYLIRAIRYKDDTFFKLIRRYWFRAVKQSY